jgi:hypothetical protein
MNSTRGQARARLTICTEGHTGKGAHRILLDELFLDDLRGITGLSFESKLFWKIASLTIARRLSVAISCRTNFTQPWIVSLMP